MEIPWFNKKRKNCEILRVMAKLCYTTLVPLIKINTANLEVISIHNFDGLYWMLVQIHVALQLEIGCAEIVCLSSTKAYIWNGIHNLYYFSIALIPLKKSEITNCAVLKDLAITILPLIAYLLITIRCLSIPPVEMAFSKCVLYKSFHLLWNILL